jgi:bifunctional non-homologous end joining protein LigD
VVDRPLTVKRYPNGVDEKFFFEKNAARGTPDWVRTVNLPAPGSTKNRDTIDYVVVEKLATLVWLANLAALELHVPQWLVPPRARKPRTDLIVFDLDPGAPASIVECCEVAVLLKDLLADEGMTLFAKTSGSKGMQVSAPVDVDDPELTSQFAHTLAERLEKQRPDLVVSRMTKSLRPGKVFVDWSQNNPAKTTVAPYSLRAKDAPTVSTPVTWDEVAAGQPLSFTSAQVLERVAERGDLFAGTLDDRLRARLTPALAKRASAGVTSRAN